MTYLKKLKDSIIKLSLSIFSALFLTITTLLVIVYMQGYTIDFKQRTIIETGVLTINTSPKKANIFINNKLSSTTKKVFPALPVGNNYQIKLKKDRYRPYLQKTAIFHGLATIINTQLIYTKDIKRQKFSLKNPDPQIIHSREGNQTFVATLNSKKNSKNNFTNTLTLQSYYYSNRILFTPQIASETIANIIIHNDKKLTWKDLTLLTNFNGSKIIVSILDKTILLNPYIFEQTIDWQDIISLPMAKHFLNKDKISWQNSTNYLLIESKDQLLTYNINTQIKSILYEKKDNTTIKYVYLEDQIAILESIKTNNKFKHILTSYSMNGGMAIFTLSLTNKVLENNAINGFWGDLETSLFALSTNKGSFLLGDLFRRSSGLIIGDKMAKFDNQTNIQKFFIPKVNRRMSLIQLVDTNMLDAKFIPIKHVISFTTISGKRSFINRFVYNREEPDLFTQLGRRVIYESNNNLEIIRWVNNGNYLAFIEDGSLNYISPRGENIYQLFTIALPFKIFILPKDQFLLRFKFSPVAERETVLVDQKKKETLKEKNIDASWQVDFIELFE